MTRSQLSRYYRWGLTTLRYEGPHILLWRLLRMAVLPLGVLRMITLCRTDLTVPLEGAQARTDLIIDQAGEADVGELVKLFNKRWSLGQIQRLFAAGGVEGEIRRRMTSGDICFVARIGSEIAHYNWIFLHAWELERSMMSIEITEDSAMMDDGFTVEEWRGKAIHSAVNGQMRLFLKQSGFRTVYTVVNTDNISSKKTLQRLNWEFVGTLLFFLPRWTDSVWYWELKGPVYPFVVHRRRTPANIRTHKG